MALSIIFCALLLITVPAFSQEQNGHPQTVLSHKTVDLCNSVYNLLDHYEARGVLPFLPTGRMFRQHQSDKMVTVSGLKASVGAQLASGDNGTFASSNIIEPYFAGDL